MKKITFLLLALVCFFFASSFVNASDINDNPRRNATKVDDVFEPYTADEWIVSPDEEPIDDQQVSNAPECDVQGVISCYDADYLRVDILLNNSVLYKLDTLYGIRLEYDDKSEYYLYSVDSEKLIYKKEKNGKIVTTKELTKNSSGDTAGITDSGDAKDTDVYFIIKKDAHIGGEKGERYYLTCYFFSGFYDKKGKMQIADQTIDVDLEFEY